MTEHDILCAARSKLGSPEAWTKLAAGRDVNGAVIDIGESGWKRCVKWDAYGAIYSVAQHGAGANVEAVTRLKAIAAGRLGRPTLHALVSYNDDMAVTHADILSLFDEAIAQCVQEQSERAA